MPPKKKLVYVSTGPTTRARARTKVDNNVGTPDLHDMPEEINQTECLNPNLVPRISPAEPTFGTDNDTASSAQESVHLTPELVRTEEIYSSSSKVEPLDLSITSSSHQCHVTSRDSGILASGDSPSLNPVYSPSINSAYNLRLNPVNSPSLNPVTSERSLSSSSQRVTKESRPLELEQNVYWEVNDSSNTHAAGQEMYHLSKGTQIRRKSESGTQSAISTVVKKRIENLQAQNSMESPVDSGSQGLVDQRESSQNDTPRQGVFRPRVNPQRTQNGIPGRSSPHTEPPRNRIVPTRNPQTGHPSFRPRQSTSQSGTVVATGFFSRFRCTIL